MKVFRKSLFACLLVLTFNSLSFSLPSQWPESGLMVVPRDTQGREARDLFAAAVEEAKSKVDLVMYTLSDPALIQSLLKAHNRGVKIRIIKEKQVYQHDNNVFKGDDPLKPLIEAGIVIKGIPQRFLDVNDKAQAHHKILIIDDQYAVLTSANWDEPTMRSTRDFSISLTKEKYPQELQEITNVFEADWNNEPITPSSPNLLWGPEQQAEKLHSFMKEAKESIAIYNQSFNDPETAALLTELAQRGIKVRLLMMPYPFGGEKDRNNPFQEQLIKGGGEVKFHLDHYLHAKAIIIDGKKAYIGSCNFYPSSLKYNRELGLITTNALILKDLLKTFESDWATSKRYDEAKDIKKDWN